MADQVVAPFVNLEENIPERDDGPFLERVKEMFPNVDINWVAERLRRGFSHDMLLNIMTSPATAQTVPKIKRQRILVEPNYSPADHPKKLKTKAAKRKAEYYFEASRKDRVQNIPAQQLQLYFRMSENLLANEFLTVSLPCIRQIANVFGGLYGPTWKALSDAVEKNAVVSRRGGPYLQVNTELGYRYVKVLKGLRQKRAVYNVPVELQEEYDAIQACSLAGSPRKSLPPSRDDLFECAICFCEKDLSEQLTCIDGHTFCSDCVQSHAKEAAYGQAMGATLNCLEIGCDAGFKRSDLKSVLEKDIFYRLEERCREESLFKADIENLERCKYCSYAVIMDVPKEVDKVFRCERCDAELCRICGRDWDERHMGLPCEELDKLDNKEQARKQLEEKMSMAVIRKCHRCGVPFEKETGCNKMTCRCGATLCYICRAPDISYDHFCRHPRNPGQPCDCKCCFLWEDAQKKDNEILREIENNVKGENTTNRRVERAEPGGLENVVAAGRIGEEDGNFQMAFPNVNEAPVRQYVPGPAVYRPVQRPGQLAHGLQVAGQAPRPPPAVYAQANAPNNRRLHYVAVHHPLAHPQVWGRRWAPPAPRFEAAGPAPHPPPPPPGIEAAGPVPHPPPRFAAAGPAPYPLPPRFAAGDLRGFEARMQQWRNQVDGRLQRIVAALERQAL